MHNIQQTRQTVTSPTQPLSQLNPTNKANQLLSQCQCPCTGVSDRVGRATDRQTLTHSLSSVTDDTAASSSQYHCAHCAHPNQNELEDAYQILPDCVVKYLFCAIPMVVHHVSPKSQ